MTNPDPTKIVMIRSSGDISPLSIDWTRFDRLDLGKNGLAARFKASWVCNSRRP